MVKFYRCLHCGSVVAKLNDLGPAPVCCGEPMKELRANEVDAAQEKHVPAFVEVDGRIDVQVGEVIHPMDPDHYIEWIFLLTTKGSRFAFLKPGDAPRASFALAEDEVVLEVYAYCNKHGLWKKAA